MTHGNKHNKQKKRGKKIIINISLGLRYAISVAFVHMPISYNWQWRASNVFCPLLSIGRRDNEPQSCNRYIILSGSEHMDFQWIHCASCREIDRIFQENKNVIYLIYLLDSFIHKLVDCNWKYDMHRQMQITHQMQCHCNHKTIWYSIENSLIFAQ